LAGTALTSDRDTASTESAHAIPKRFMIDAPHNLETSRPTGTTASQDRLGGKSNPPLAKAILTKSANDSRFPSLSRRR
jgi:hypothetical protein